MNLFILFGMGVLIVLVLYLIARIHIMEEYINDMNEIRSRYNKEINTINTNYLADKIDLIIEALNEGKEVEIID